jgi:hypothetical protein
LLPLFFHAGKKSILFVLLRARDNIKTTLVFRLHAPTRLPKKLQDFHLMHTEGVRENNYINHVVRDCYVAFVYTDSTSPTSCAVTTRCVTARLVVRSHQLYISYGMHRDCSSLSRSGSTSTTSCTVTTRLLVAPALPHQHHALRLLLSRSHRLYINNTVRRDYSSPGRTSSTSTTSWHSDYSSFVRFGSTSTTSCAVTTRLLVALALLQLHSAP